MKDDRKTKRQLINELVELRQRITELEASGNQCRQTEEKLSDTKQLLENIAQGITEGILLLSKDFEILWANEAFLDQSGYKMKEVLGNYCYKVTHHLEGPCRPPHHPCPIYEIKKTSKPLTMLHNHFDRKGNEFFVEVSAYPIVDEKGEIIQLVHLSRDVTERKRVEEALRKAHHELERRVEERTAELMTANEQLRHEIEERKRAEEALKRSKASLAEAQRIAHLGNWDWNIVTNKLQWSDEIYRIFGLTPQEFGATYEAFLDAVHPDDREFVQQAVNRAVYEHAPYSIDHRITRPDGTERTVHEEGEVFFDEPGKPIRMVGTVHDITERKRAEEEQTRLRRRVEALWEIARMVEADYQALCDRILVEIMDMAQSPYAFYGFLNNDESIMSLYSWSKQALEECQIQKKPLEYPIIEAGLWGDAVRERRTLIINDYQADQPSKKGLPQGHVPITKILVVPIFSRGRIVALAAVANKHSDYKEEDARQIEGFVTSVQVILERRKMEDAVRESEKELRSLSSQLITVQEKERKRVAQELHDGIGQSLTAIKFGVENALRQTGKSTTMPGVESLETIVALIQETIEEVRSIQMDLRPSTLDDLGILATITWFCREFQTIYSGIRVEKEISIQENEVPEPLKTVIFRVLQEALNNVAKHSKADLVHLGLRKIDGTIELAIKDNGLGFDLSDVLSVEGSKRGLGLTSMKERTEISGGSFAIQSIKEEGTTIRASWPTE